MSRAPRKPLTEAQKLREKARLKARSKGRVQSTRARRVDLGLGLLKPDFNLPCTFCAHQRLCAAQKLACRDYAVYVSDNIPSRGDPLGIERQPGALYFKLAEGKAPFDQINFQRSYDGNYSTKVREALAECALDAETRRG